jgi:hypothetical protein
VLGVIGFWQDAKMRIAGLWLCWLNGVGIVLEIQEAGKYRLLSTPAEWL